MITDIDKKSVLIPNNKDNHLTALTEPEDIKQLLIDNSIGESLNVILALFVSLN